MIQKVLISSKLKKKLWEKSLPLSKVCWLIYAHLISVEQAAYAKLHALQIFF